MPNSSIWRSMPSLPPYKPAEPASSAAVSRLWNNEALLQYSYTVSFNEKKVRYLDKLYWFEYAHNPSLEARLEFINQLIDKIRNLSFPKQQPLNMVSHASEGLLTEYLIDKGLAEAGFTDVRWRLIDYTCNLEKCRDNLTSFSSKVATPVMVFNGDTDYLYRMTDGLTSAQRDREEGGTIILGCNPPPPLPLTYDSQGRIQPEEGLLLRGRYIPRGGEGNSICIAFRHPDDRSAFNTLYENIAILCKGVRIKAAVRFSVQNSTLSFACSDDSFGRRLQEALNIALGERHAAQASNDPDFLQEKESSTAACLTRAIDVARRLSGEPLEARSFRYMDYDIGLAALGDFFQQGRHPHLYATLENNHTASE